MPNMRAFRIWAAGAATASTLLALPLDSEAQVRRDTLADTAKAGGVVTIVPGPTYGAGSFTRSILGAGWRDVWLTPVTVPVLDLGAYSGGLEIDKRGGGFQTITLHMTEKDGWREYRFRSVDKFPMLRLPRTLQGTMAGNIIQDQTASLFPAGPLLAPPFVEAIGGLHVVPKLYVMPDDPRLGQHREAFAGMLGTMELKGEEAPDDKPGFAGSRKIKDTDKFFADLSESREHRVDEHEFLAVRLVDFLINDGDRTPDNYDWARFDRDGGYLWRPISRDRDRAFTDASGLLNQLIVRRFYPKFTAFTTKYSLRGLMSSSHIFDRRLLQRLTAQDFEQVAKRVQAVVSDSVIEAAIAALPSEWREKTDADDRIRTTLIARRAMLPEAALAFYEKLAGEPDIHLTNDNERVSVERHPDGRVTVIVPGRPARIVATAPETPNPGGGATRTMGGTIDLRGAEAPPFYQRTFLPDETNEIRVYLGKGDDVAVVHGAATDKIIVRLIGDAGADFFADSAGGGATYFYDSEGDNVFIKARGTQVSEKTWDAPEPVFGFSPGTAWRPDWGKSKGWRPVVQHLQGAGIVLGVGPRFRSYGFRRLPYLWDVKTAFLVGTRNGRMGLTADADYHAENSPLALTVDARLSQLNAFRFYGYGNDTPNVGDLSLVEQNVASIEPSLVWHLGWRARDSKQGNIIVRDDSTEGQPPGMRPMVGELRFGTLVSWNDPVPELGAPLLAPGVMGGDSFGHVGFRLGVELEATDHDAVPTRGWSFRATAAGYPEVWDVPSAFGTMTATGAAYLPLGNGGTNVALRAGGMLAGGDFPAQYAAYVGSSTLRGYRNRRFAGDAAATGTTELRVPVGTLNFIVRSKVGVLGLADIGRVWFDGQSEGGWHTGVGGGIWLSALGKVVSAQYAVGETGRFYLKGGLAF